MRLLTINADNGGCGKYRIFEPANAVVAQFPDIFVSHSRMIDISRAATYDAVIIQRPLFQGYAEAIPEMQRRGTKVIIDIDDDLTDVHPENYVYANLQPETSPRSNWEHALKACELADLVICSTDTLASKFKSAHGGSVVINNYLPDSILGIHGKHHAGRIRIGWAGHTQTHPNDLPAVGSSIRNAVRKSKAEFVVLGGGPQVPEQVRLETSQFRTIPSAPITQYYKTIADNFDVGIAPLELTDFNEAKCLDKDTKVLTQTGIRNIGDIKVGDKVYDRHGNLKEVLGRSIEPTRTGLSITTEDGYSIALSKEHRLLVNNQWVHGVDMSIGDTLHLSTITHSIRNYVQVNWPSDSRMTRGIELSGQEFTSKEDTPKITITPRWGRILGAFCGDGCFAGKTSICFSCDGIDQDWIDLLIEDIDQIGVRATNVEKKMFNGTILRKRDIRIASAHLIRFLQSLGLSYYKENGHPKRLVKVPDVIWNSPLDVVAEFLSGYFEADGTTHSSGVSATSKDIDFLQDIQKLLLMFGIQSKLTQKKSHSQNGYEGVYGLLTLGKYASVIFQERIGFKSQRKQNKLAVICDRKPSNATKAMRFNQKIVLIEEVEITPVDIQVEGEEFIANGFVSHNSWLKMLEYAGLGIPAIGSATTENIHLHDAGIGLIAQTHGDWNRAISLMISSDRKREKLGEDSRKIVKEKFTYSKNAWRWAEAWRSVLS